MHENCDTNCPLEPRVAALEAANNQKSDTHREIFRRLNDVERKSAVQEAQYEAIEDTLEEIKTSVDAIASRPGKRWDGMADKILWFVIQAILVVAAVKIGLM